jgi:uncharacterized membrane protein YphA (DoxX/SURF4 family)
MLDPLLLPLAILALILVLVVLSVSFTPQLGPGSGVNRGTRFFLVLLRLAIGWHFLFEGVAKLTDPTWTSEGYLREASGPLADWFQDVAGDRLKDRLTVGPDGSFPDRLGEEWQVYFDRFSSHYDLTDKQLDEANTKFEQAQQRTLKFLTQEKRPVKVPAKVPPVFEASLTVPERINLYEEKLDQARKAEEHDVPLNATSGWAHVRDFKTQANVIRAGLKKDLDAQTKGMMDALESVLTTEQKEQSRPQAVRQLPLSYISEWSRLDWADFLVKWGLLLVGLFLIAGLFTRTACVVAALFLLSFFLAMPPLPGLPESPRAEGHYLYINKNIIELLACLALATTRSGRWAGLDGLLQFLFPSAWRSRPLEEVPVMSAGRPVLGPAGLGGVSPPARPPSEEITHGP